MEKHKHSKACIICGRNDSGELTRDEKLRNLAQRDIRLTHCSGCGEVVCGFCNDLGVCCDGSTNEWV